MKKTVIKRVTTLLLIVALCASIAIAIVACDGKKANAPVVDQNGNAIAEGVTTSLPKGIVYTADAVTTAEPVTRTFKATVTPSNATNKELIWSLAWKNASSEWASGKNIGEYLTLSSSGMSATLTCSQAFGEQAIITVRSNDDPDIYKNCTIDYQFKISDFKLELYQDGTLLGELDSDSYENNGYYDDENKVLHHNHIPKLSVKYLLDPAHNFSFKLKPIFSVGSIGKKELNIGYTILGGIYLEYVQETIYRFAESKSSINSAFYNNLRPKSFPFEGWQNTSDNPVNPFKEYVIPLGTQDLRQFFFYNGLLPSDSQVRDIVNFAATNNLCLFRLKFNFSVNGSYRNATFCFGADNTTLNVAVSDLTIDNSQVII